MKTLITICTILLSSLNLHAQQMRLYHKGGGVITSETGIAPYITKDYLVVLGDLKPDGSWAVRYSIKYGIMMIWMSSCLLLLSILYGTIKRYEH